MSKQTTRRDFVKQSATVAGLAATFGSAPEYIKASVFGSNDRINLGFIGVGGRGSSLLGLFAPSVQAQPFQVVAVCDVYKKRLTAAQNRVETLMKAKPDFATTDYREIIGRKDIDAVVVA